MFLFAEPVTRAEHESADHAGVVKCTTVHRGIERSELTDQPPPQTQCAMGL